MRTGVSILTSAISATSVFLFLSIGSLELARADELDEIQSSRESAEMQYVNEIATGKYKTEAQRDSLRKKYLEPHEQRTRDYFKKISELPAPRKVRPEEIDISNGNSTEAERLLEQGANSSRSVSTLSEGSEKNSYSKDKSAGRPEYVLDGSNIPKEVTFESSKPAPAQLPSPKPSLKH